MEMIVMQDLISQTGLFLKGDGRFGLQSYGARLGAGACEIAGCS